MTGADHQRARAAADDPVLKDCRREALWAIALWLVQSMVMVGAFLTMGYYRNDDPFGYPFGLPSWYLFGGIVPAIVFLAVIIWVVQTQFKDRPLR